MKCKTCGLEKPQSEFHLSNRWKSGRRPHCKPCRKIASANEYRNNPEAFNARTKKWRDKNPGYEHKRHLLRRYGLSTSLYNALIESQNNCCAICGREVKLIVDHCHVSGTVRGLLCYPCNTGLGQFLDDPDLIEKAAYYLRKTDYAKI